MYPSFRWQGSGTKLGDIPIGELAFLCRMWISHVDTYLVLGTLGVSRFIYIGCLHGLRFNSSYRTMCVRIEALSSDFLPRILLLEFFFWFSVVELPV